MVREHVEKGSIPTTRCGSGSIGCSCSDTDVLPTLDVPTSAISSPLIATVSRNGLDSGPHEAVAAVVQSDRGQDCV